MTERIKRLRNFIINKEHHKFRARHSLSIFNDGAVRQEPFIMRKALALSRILESMPVAILDDELIVGMRTLFGLPEYVLPEEKVHREEGKAKILGYGDIFDSVYNLCEDERGTGEFNGTPAGYSKVLQMGLSGIKEFASRRLNDDKWKKSRDFYRAVCICCDAVVNFARRHSQEAEHLAGLATDEKRKKELETVAEICLNVPASPARSLQEALQSIWFVHLSIWAAGHFLVPVGRLDQFAYPYYKMDIAQGKLNKNDALELLESFWLKFNMDIDKTHGEPKFEADTGQTLMIGGQTPDGKDATNELSYLCIDCARELRVTDPRLQVRIHKNSPEEFFSAAAGLMKEGMGFPTVCNDETIVPALVQNGYSLEDARGYSCGGCWETTVPGKSDDRTNSGVINLLRCLEWTLNRGRNFLDNKKLGLDTGSIKSFKTFQQFYNAFKKQVSYYVERVVENCNRAVFSPSPILSATMNDCLEKGLDISEGGCQYNNTGLLGNALANAADSFYVIKKLVFEQRELTLSGLREMLLKNYENCEDLRLRMLNKFPKYGNDNDEVDDIAKDIATYFCKTVADSKNVRGGKFKPGLFSAGTYVFVGKQLGASPDGRKAGEPFAISCSPGLGQDRSGPTAVIKSFTKLNLINAGNGAIMDLKLHPTALAGEEGTEKMAAVLKSFIALGGTQMQVNVIDSKMLREAQKDPHRYRDLMVRIWGFSAYFVSLPKEFQDHVIARTEHMGT